MSSGLHDDPLLEDALGSLLGDGERRGASELLGLILLIAVVIAVAGVVIGMGGTAIQQTQGESEVRHAENAFANLDSQVSTVAFGGGSEQRSVQMGLRGSSGAGLSLEDGANVKIMSCSLQREEGGDDGEDIEEECRDEFDGMKALGGRLSPSEIQNLEDMEDLEAKIDTDTLTSAERDAVEQALSDDEGFDRAALRLDEDISSLVYEREDEKIAYQAGGIWEYNKKDDFSYMLSAPPVDYADSTFSMPLVDLTSDSQQVSDSFTVEQSGSDADPLHGVSGPVKEELVTVYVSSEYYEAWGQYFEDHVEGNVNARYDHANESVEVDLGLTGDIRGSFDSAIVADGDISVNSGGDISGSPIVSSGSVNGVDDDRVVEHVQLSLLELDSHIDILMAEAESNYKNTGVIDDSTTLEHTEETEGRYYVDEIDLKNDKLTLDVSEGDITLLVDGDTSVQRGVGAIEVVGANCSAEPNDDGEKCENHVRFLTNNNFNLDHGSGHVYTGGNPEAFQLYGGSETNIRIANGTTFEGVIYAPTGDNAHGGNIGKRGNCHNSEPNICIGGSSTVTGAIVGGSTIIANGATVNYDEDLRSFNPEVSPDKTIRPRLMNLHVSVNEVSVDG